MAKAMLDHLSQIIGKEDELTYQVYQAKNKVLGATKTKVSRSVVQEMEKPFAKEECLQALKKMGKEKSPGWDGITAQIYVEFWEELANPWLSLIN